MKTCFPLDAAIWHIFFQTGSIVLMVHTIYKLKVFNMAIKFTTFNKNKHLQTAIVSNSMANLYICLY